MLHIDLINHNKERLMITESQLNIVKSTIPLLQSGGEILTKHFYNIMLNEYTDVRPLFNKANQISGDQPRALANSILMYAQHIDDLEKLTNLVNIIIHKHCSLQILPEHYPIVGTCLLRAIKEVLGPDIATNEVIAAWQAAYQQLANILINAEEKLYKQQELAEDGWRGERLFTVVKKVTESTEVTSFYLEPKDGKAIIRHKSGQFLGLRFILLEGEQRRNYSISEVANGHYYRISVKREKQGIVSNHLHNDVKEGDTLRVFPPFGDFTLQTKSLPLVLISGGVGITPLIAMVQEALITQRTIYFIHSARNYQIDPFYEYIHDLSANHKNLHTLYCYEDNSQHYANIEGYLTKEILANTLPHEKIDTYFLGPMFFMQKVRDFLLELGVDHIHMHYEFFGPAKLLTH